MNDSKQMTLKITKARSLLPNSSPEILKPMPGAGGVLQVIWIEQIDAHGLFYQRDGAESACLVATHHNGHSCRALAERIIQGDQKLVLDQLDYIQRCGGTASNAQFLPCTTSS